jgi:hypothetical protein
VIRRPMWRPTRRPVRRPGHRCRKGRVGVPAGNLLSPRQPGFGPVWADRSLRAKRRDIRHPAISATASEWLLEGCWWRAGGSGRPVSHRASQPWVEAGSSWERPPRGASGHALVAGRMWCSLRGKADPDPLQEPRRAHAVAHSPPIGRSGGVDAESVNERHTGCEWWRGPLRRGYEVAGEPSGEWRPRCSQRPNAPGDRAAFSNRSVSPARRSDSCRISGGRGRTAWCCPPEAAGVTGPRARRSGQGRPAGPVRRTATASLRRPPWAVGCGRAAATTAGPRPGVGARPRRRRRGRSYPGELSRRSRTA